VVISYNQLDIDLEYLYIPRYVHTYMNKLPVYGEVQLMALQVILLFLNLKSVKV
jgi:hypothetical protein